MPTDTPLAPAVRSETAAPYAACAGAPPPSAETLLARMERAEPATLDDHELLGLVGIQPSFADRAITKRLAEALTLVDVRLIDHFVVGDGESVSFAARGLL